MLFDLCMDKCRIYCEQRALIDGIKKQKKVFVFFWLFFGETLRSIFLVVTAKEMMKKLLDTRMQKVLKRANKFGI